MAVTLVIVIRASRNNKTAADYYAAGRSFTGPQNGIAIAGDYLSAASFLGITGAIAINGYDGFLYSIGFLVAWLVALLLVAELLRNTGKFTMADVLSFRLKQRPVRIAAAISTLAVCFFYLLAQMAGAGGLVSLLLGINDWVRPVAGHRRRRRPDDHVRADRRHEGHHLGADHQGRACSSPAPRVMTIWVLAMYGFNLYDAARRARSRPPATRRSSNPGLQYGKTETPSSTSSPSRSPWCSAPRACRTC